MLFALTLGSAYALDCAGLDPDLCTAANEGAAHANAAFGQTILEDAAPAARHRTQRVYDLLDGMASEVEAAGCSLDSITWGHQGGAYDSGAGTFGGTISEGATDGSFTGTVDHGARAFDGSWALDGDAGVMGVGFSGYDRNGRFAASKDGSDFFIGRWIRVQGRRGVLVGLHGECDANAVGARILPDMVFNEPEPEFTSVAVVGEPDELDFTGDFQYALNVGDVGGQVVGDAVFTTDIATPGVTMGYINTIPFWHTSQFGSTSDDDNLEGVMRSIRWTANGQTPAGFDNGTVNVVMDDLVVGRQYKLQALFAEDCCVRGFHVLVDGDIIVEDLSTNLAGTFNSDSTSTLVAVTHVFTATEQSLHFELDAELTAAQVNDGIVPPNATNADHNPILNGLTLEAL